MAEHATNDHHHGQMPVAEQRTTFQSFVGMTKWGSLSVAVALLILTVWFCTSAGFLTALVLGAILAVLGGFALGRRGGH